MKNFSDKNADQTVVMHQEVFEKTFNSFIIEGAENDHLTILSRVLFSLDRNDTKQIASAILFSYTLGMQNARN